MRSSAISAHQGGAVWPNDVMSFVTILMPFWEVLNSKLSFAITFMSPWKFRRSTKEVKMMGGVLPVPSGAASYGWLGARILLCFLPHYPQWSKEPEGGSCRVRCRCVLFSPKGVRPIS